MSLTVLPVSSIYIAQLWQKLEAGVKESLDSSDMVALYTVDNVRQYLTSGEWFLFVAINEQNEIKGFAVIALANYPLHRVATIMCLSGKWIVSQKILKQLTDILKNQMGVTLVHGYCNSIIARLHRKNNLNVQQVNRVEVAL